jgi:hypothetical protein
MTLKFTRRRMLRGLMQGATISVALPFLDCFLDGNGTALASGAPVPLRFGTWFWGCGMNIARWVPKKIGSDYDIPPELKAMEGHKGNVCILSGFNTLLDGRSNFCHYTGQYAIRSGAAPLNKDSIEGPTFDTAIAAQIGSGSRFRSIEVAASGDPRDSYSRTAPAITNPAEISPVALYQRIFGSEFKDPNAAEFTPDPKIMVRKSVLSAVKEDHEAFVKTLGSADRQRLDQYMTSLRQTEQQLALQLVKPPPAEACVRPKGPPAEARPSASVDAVQTNHKLFAELVVMALACNQTRVFNIVFSPSSSTLAKPGSTVTHHQATHEELVDEKLGYQPNATWFVEQAMSGWGTFLDTISAVREGDRTLLDNSLVFAHSDTQFAKVHSLNSIPMMIAGTAGGRIKSGQHIAVNGDPVTRVGFTIQQIMGLSVANWGYRSMQTSKTITELLT